MAPEENFFFLDSQRGIAKGRRCIYEGKEWSFWCGHSPADQNTFSDSGTESSKMNKLLQLLEIKEEAINEQKKYFSINSVIETLDAAIDIYLVSKERRKAKVKARVGV